jgi:hypothetical protein
VSHLFASANEIDKLKSNKDVELFLETKIDSLWKYLSPFENNKANNSKFTKAGFLKVDIDSNGLTDLLIYGQACFVVLDTGNQHYSLYGNYSPPYNCIIETSYEFVDLISSNNIPLLVFKRIENSQHSISRNTPQNDTMIFKFGNFIEYNAKPDNLQIEEINLKSDGGYGAGKFTIDVDALGCVSYQDGYDFKLLTGEIDKKTFDNIIQTINYMKLRSLQDNYDIENTTDLPMYNLEITFNGGETKKITDYGASGTSSLHKLYDQLLNLKPSLTELN